MMLPKIEHQTKALSCQFSHSFTFLMLLPQESWLSFGQLHEQRFAVPPIWLCTPFSVYSQQISPQKLKIQHQCCKKETKFSSLTQILNNQQNTTKHTYMWFFTQRLIIAINMEKSLTLNQIHSLKMSMSINQTQIIISTHEGSWHAPYNSKFQDDSFKTFIASSYGYFFVAYQHGLITNSISPFQVIP